MRDRRRFAGVAGLCLFAGLALSGPGAAQTPESSHFAYDSSVPLNVKLVSAEIRGGVTIQDITYTGAGGDTVPATLVIPKGGGKFAGIIWGHWLMAGVANANRSEFLDEAVALAPKGVVSLLIDAPWSRPDFHPVPGSGPLIVAQQVIDLRRGLDLLRVRPGMDAGRIAYVGHSIDAKIGALLDATDKRFAAFVFMSGPQSESKTVAWENPGAYAGKFGPAPALFQYGLHDDAFVPVAEARAYVSLVSGPKTVKFYDAGHALNAQARTDRDDFLTRILKLGS